jgi:hypothetical protein
MINQPMREAAVEVDDYDVEGAVVDHDHAWRRVTTISTDLSLGEYRCDICSATWEM